MLGGKNYQEDLDELAGPTRPATENDRAPLGSSVGENGVFGRRSKDDNGWSIDIPANGDKPHETLHYPDADDADSDNDSEEN